MGEINVGEAAPDFTLPTDGGGEVRLADLRGQAVVLYFYPKDDTSGCTLEAIEFTALAPEFEAEKTVVVGISPDSVKSHDSFKKKHSLTVRLAADENKDVVGRYGVWVKKSRYGREYMGVDRTTILIGKDGRIAQIWNKVTAKGHAEAVLDAVRQMN